MKKNMKDVEINKSKIISLEQNWHAERTGL